MTMFERPAVFHLERLAPAASVSVVLDGWNAVLGAADGFGYSLRALSTFSLDLPRLADAIAARRDRPSRVQRIGIVMGMHDARTNRASHAAQAAAAREWQRDPRVTLIDPGMVRVVNSLDSVNSHLDSDSDRFLNPSGVVVPLHRHCELRGDETIQRLLTEWTDDRQTDAEILVSADADHLEHALIGSVTSDRNPRKAA